MDGFAASFADADAVVLPPIYAARDTAEDVRAVTAACLAAKVNAVVPRQGRRPARLRRRVRPPVGDHRRRAT